MRSANQGSTCNVSSAITPSVEVRESVLDGYVGTDQLAPEARLRVSRDGSELLLERADRPPLSLLPEAESTFFTPDGWDARWIFDSDAAGDVTRLLARRRGKDLVWARVD